MLPDFFQTFGFRRWSTQSFKSGRAFLVGPGSR